MPLTTGTDDLTVVRASELPIGPNRFLIGLSLLLGVVPMAAFILGHLPLTPTYLTPTLAVSLSGAMTTLLYGLYPVPAMKATFGRFAAVGPAALGVFLFFGLWRGMNEMTKTQRFVLLQNINNSALNSAELPGKTKVMLVDVDSLADDKLKSILVSIKLGLSKAGVTSTGDEELKTAFTAIVRSLEFGDAHQSEALKLLQDFIANRPVDEEWTKLVQAVANEKASPADYIKRVKREPFAIVRVEKNGAVEARVLLAGDSLDLFGTTYNVPVIANPATRVTKGIYEAVILQAR